MFYFITLLFWHFSTFSLSLLALLSFLHRKKFFPTLIIKELKLRGINDSILSYYSVLKLFDKLIHYWLGRLI